MKKDGSVSEKDRPAFKRVISEVHPIVKRSSRRVRVDQSTLVQSCLQDEERTFLSGKRCLVQWHWNELDELAKSCLAGTVMDGSGMIRTIHDGVAEITLVRIEGAWTNLSPVGIPGLRLIDVGPQMQELYCLRLDEHGFGTDIIQVTLEDFLDFLRWDIPLERRNLHLNMLGRVLAKADQQDGKTNRFIVVRSLPAREEERGCFEALLERGDPQCLILTSEGSAFWLPRARR